MICRQCKKESNGTTQCDPCHSIMVKSWVKEAETKYNLHPFKKEKAGQVGKTVV